MYTEHYSAAETWYSRHWERHAGTVTTFWRGGKPDIPHGRVYTQQRSVARPHWISCPTEGQCSLGVERKKKEKGWQMVNTLVRQQIVSPGGWKMLTRIEVPWIYNKNKKQTCTLNAANASCIIKSDALKCCTSPYGVMDSCLFLNALHM